MVSWAFLLLAVLGAWLTLNAHRPHRGFGPITVPSFFAGWLHSELVLHALALQATIVAAAIWLGALERGVGWVGLFITAASWGGMASLLLHARQTGRTLGSALRAGLGDDYKRGLPPRARARLGVRLPWTQLAAPLWFRRGGFEWIRDVPFVEGGHPRQRLDIYRRRGSLERAPVLIQVHGGGWVIGNKRQQGVPLMLHMAAQGWICVSTNYRLSPSATFPDHIIDIKRAIAWVREHIAEYGGDPEFIVITGGSAGG
ncbi:MAG: alpha/beta hydrolase, partial [Myxococcales bacterium]|nr:alpha/beta hydrolase [Myxococcales bacterium]